jgi:hypothetical protein
MPWVAHEDSSDYGLDRTLVIARVDGVTGDRSFVQPLSFTEVAQGISPPPDAIALRGKHEVTAFLQAVMDAAYEAGLRPSRAQDERHLKAHLEDMRRFAFHTIKEKP